MSESISAKLRAVPFLSSLPQEFLDRIAGTARGISLPAGSVVFRQGDEAKLIYVTIAGNAALEICVPGIGCKRIMTVGPGGLLGWSPLLQQARMTATARALTDVDALELDAARVLEICDNQPQFGYAFMKQAALVLASRLNATRLQFLDVYGNQMAPVPNEQPAPAGARPE